MGRQHTNVERVALPVQTQRPETLIRASPVGTVIVAGTIAVGGRHGLSIKLAVKTANRLSKEEYAEASAAMKLRDFAGAVDVK